MANSNKVKWSLNDLADLPRVLSEAFPPRDTVVAIAPKDIAAGELVYAPVWSGQRVLNPITLEYSDGTTLIESHARIKEPEVPKRVGRKITFAGDCE